MARLRISGPAVQDLAGILSDSEAAWGAEARRRYQALIEAALRTIAADPTDRLTRDRSILLPGLRCLHLRLVRSRSAERVAAPVHLVYFRPAGDGAVEVLRVLHERMEPARHFPKEG